MEGSCESSRRDDFKSSGSSQAIDLGDKRYTGANYIGEGHGNYPETHSQPAWPKSASPPSAWQGSRSNVNKSRPLVFRPGTRLGGLIFPGLQQPQKPENWYRCDQCPQAFLQTDDLEGHKQQHLAAQQYACGGCKRAFFAQDALNSHSEAGCPGDGRGKAVEASLRPAPAVCQQRKAPDQAVETSPLSQPVNANSEFSKLGTGTADRERPGPLNSDRSQMSKPGNTRAISTSSSPLPLESEESSADEDDEFSTTSQMSSSLLDAGDCTDTVDSEVSTSDSSSGLAPPAVSEEPTYPLSHEKDQLLGILLRQYIAYRTHAGESSAPNNTSKPEPKKNGEKSKQTVRGKKRANEDVDDDDGDVSSDSGGRVPKKPKGLGEATQGRRYFACPFFKKDPIKYSDCHRYRLSRIRDVKQHLRRHHSRPIYCPICGDNFRKEEDRDIHVRSRVCQEVSFRIDRFTEAQQEKLSEKLPPNTSKEAQWLAMFAIVFPGHNPPASAYIDPELSEETRLFQDYITRVGPSFLLGRLQQQQPHIWDSRDESFLKELLGDALAHLAAGWSRHRTLLEQGGIAIADEAAGPHGQAQFETPPRAPWAVEAFTNYLPALSASKDWCDAQHVQSHFQAVVSDIPLPGSASANVSTNEMGHQDGLEDLLLTLNTGLGSTGSHAEGPGECAFDLPSDNASALEYFKGADLSNTPAAYPQLSNTQSTLAAFSSNADFLSISNSHWQSSNADSTSTALFLDPRRLSGHSSKVLRPVRAAPVQSEWEQSGIAEA